MIDVCACVFPHDDAMLKAMTVFADRTMCLEMVDGTAVLVHSAHNPSKGDWQAMLAACEEDLGAGRLQGLLVIAETSAPDAVQRKAASDLWTRVSMPPMAIVSSSRLMRAAATAVNFFFPQPAKLFSPEDLDDAIAHVQSKSPAAVKAAIRRMKTLIETTLEKTADQ